MISPRTAAFWLWLIWFSTWWLAAFWADRAVARPRLSLGILHRLLASAGFALLFLAHFGGAAGGPISRRLIAPLYPETPVVGWILVGQAALGFGFCWWARLHLGRLWSGATTVKADHRVIDSGPYRLVRHPIYTGVIAAAAFTAAIEAGPAAMIGAGLIGLGFWMTARSEERFLRQELGAAAYDAYARRTPMLVPGLGR